MDSLPLPSRAALTRQNSSSSRCVLPRRSTTEVDAGRTRAAPLDYVGESLPREHSRLPVRRLDGDWLIQGGAHSGSLARASDTEISSRVALVVARLLLWTRILPDI